MTPTDETRFHALKFAIQNRTGDDARCLVKDAETFASFLALGSVPTPEQPAEDVELADLTESYPADEPVIAMADSPMEAGEIVDELFGHRPSAEAVATMQIIEDANAEVGILTGYSSAVAGSVSDVRDWINAGPADEPVTATEMRAYIDAVEAEVPTEAEITAAVEQIAGPSPVTEDASEAPEMTDEQVEATEDHWRLASDQIGAAEHEPEKELEPVGAHMRFAPWFATRK